VYLGPCQPSYRSMLQASKVAATKHDNSFWVCCCYCAADYRSFYEAKQQLILDRRNRATAAMRAAVQKEKQDAGKKRVMVSMFVHSSGA
jgi:hypothetical protein